MNNINVRYNYFNTFDSLKEKTNELIAIFYGDKMGDCESTDPISVDDINNLSNLIKQIRDEIEEYNNIITEGEYNFFNVLEEESTDFGADGNNIDTKRMIIAAKILGAIKADILIFETSFAKIATPEDPKPYIFTWDIFEPREAKHPTCRDFMDMILYFGAECLNKLAIIGGRIQTEIDNYLSPSQRRVKNER
jgi:hypothetical protein